MKYFFIAGERSGDTHASDLIQTLFRIDPTVEIVGWGGTKMESAGMKLLRHYSLYSFMGFGEVLSKAFLFYAELSRCKRNLLSENPECIILIDFAGFNMQMAKFAKMHGIKVVFYISPKFWAWNSGRVKKFGKYLDHLCCILPFEPKEAAKFGFPDASYVGNPSSVKIQARDLDRVGHYDCIALFPGSRIQELTNHISVLCDLISSSPDHQFVVSKVDNLTDDSYLKFLKYSNVVLFEGDTVALCSQYNVSMAVVASGTASLELALLKMPQVVIYKTGIVTYFLAKLVTRIRYISLVNILLNRPLVPELIQKKCNSDNILKAIKEIRSIEKQKKISEGYSEIRNILGSKNPAEQTAQIVLQLSRS